MRPPVLAAILVGLALAVPGQARELHWRHVDVAARLEADGALRVVETQTMVFTGDWNGGERSFANRSFGQRVQLVRLSRFDAATNGWIDLREGDLGEVDEYAWHDSRTLRWRSRQPYDPPFSASELVYRLELVYTGILSETGSGGWRLDHDFLFADRAGPIGAVTFDLELAPEWELATPATLSLSTGQLQPGEGLVVTRELRYLGAGRPERATPPALPRAVALLLPLALLLALGERWLAWRRRDGALGRFEPLPDRATIDRAWLETHVFGTAPEVIGAAWDRTVGGAEVAALIARLVAEGKIESRVEKFSLGPFRRENLHLRRLVPVEEMDAVAQPLIRGLFPLGDTIDTLSLRQHYRSQGFDPVSKIRKTIEKKVAAQRGFGKGSRKPSPLLTAMLLLAALAAIAIGAVMAPDGVAGVLLGAGLLVAAIPGWVGAGVGQSKVGTPGASLVAILVSVLVQVALVSVAAFAPGLPLPTRIGVLLWAVGLQRSMLHTLMSRESVESMARRRELTAAREFFAAELRRERPALEDRWFPWLVAFGLAPQLDGWFRVHGAAHGGNLVSTAGSGGGTFAGGGWTGGGGAFGGAGASASFAAAAVGMAAGVSAPSSSGGGGGGGGGSSGGGGGGGW